MPDISLVLTKARQTRRRGCRKAPLGNSSRGAARGTQTPMGQILSLKPGNVQLLGGGKSATLTSRVRGVQKFLSWLAIQQEVVFATSVSQLLDLLQVRWSDPCNRGSLEGSHRSLVFLAPAVERPTNSQLYEVSCKELLFPATSGPSTKLRNQRFQRSCRKGGKQSSKGRGPRQGYTTDPHRRWLPYVQLHSESQWSSSLSRKRQGPARRKVSVKMVRLVVASIAVWAVQNRGSVRQLRVVP